MSVGYIYIDIYIFFRVFLLRNQNRKLSLLIESSVNYNIHFLFYLVLTIVGQDTKICNGTTNDFSRSCLWIFLLLWKREGKKTIRTSLMSL